MKKKIINAKRPELIYTATDNPHSIEVLKAVKNALTAQDIEISCKTIEPSARIINPSQPSLVLFDTTVDNKTFMPLARGMKKRKKIPEWGLASEFGIAITSRCTSKDSRIDNIVNQITKWFFTDRFEAWIADGQYPWGPPPKERPNSYSPRSHKKSSPWGPKVC